MHAIKDLSGAARLELAGGNGIHHVCKADLNRVLAVEYGQLKGRIWRPAPVLRLVKAGVIVAIGRLPHGRRMAGGARGHPMTTVPDHVHFSPPPPVQAFCGEALRFQLVSEAIIYIAHHVTFGYWGSLIILSDVLTKQ